MKNSEKIINLFQLRWDASGGTASNYTDASSVAAYGTREEVQTDTRITLAATADQRGNGEIADLKDIKIEAKLRINAKYNIESVHPGDTCTVVNLKKGSTLFGDNMLITSVAYDPDGITIELENGQPSFADVFNNAVDQQANKS